jgi:hypothetical protein
MRRAAVTLAIVFATSTATGQTTGHKLARKPRMGLVYAGAGMLAGGFIASFITAIAYSFKGLSPVVLVPVAGPFIGFGWDMAHQDRCPLDVSTGSCSSLLVDPGLFAMGLVETIGVGLLSVGLVPHEVRTPVNVTFNGSRFTVSVDF